MQITKKKNLQKIGSILQEIDNILQDLRRSYDLLGWCNYKSIFIVYVELSVV